MLRIYIVVDDIKYLTRSAAFIFFDNYLTLTSYSKVFFSTKSTSILRLASDADEKHFETNLSIFCYNKNEIK